MLVLRNTIVTLIIKLLIIILTIRGFIIALNTMLITTRAKNQCDVMIQTYDRWRLTMTFLPVLSVRQKTSTSS